MAQQYITMNGTKIAQPHKLGYSFESTYTEDSGRVQTGVAKVSRMFTVESFSLSWEYLSLSEAHTIIQIIEQGTPFSFHYPSVYYNGWRTAQFYVGKGQVNWGRINADEELVEDFSFNCVGVNPI